MILVGGGGGLWGSGERPVFTVSQLPSQERPRIQPTTRECNAVYSVTPLNNLPIKVIKLGKNQFLD
jgi:hypothetical protein